MWWITAQQVPKHPSPPSRVLEVGHLVSRYAPSDKRIMAALSDSTCPMSGDGIMSVKAALISSCLLMALGFTPQTAVCIVTSCMHMTLQVPQLSAQMRFSPFTMLKPNLILIYQMRQKYQLFNATRDTNFEEEV